MKPNEPGAPRYQDRCHDGCPRIRNKVKGAPTNCPAGPRCLAALSIPLSPGSYLPASPRAARETNRRRRRALASSADWQQGTNPAFAGTSSRAEKRPRGASPLWPGCCFHIFPRRLPNMGFLRSKTPERLAPRARDSPRSRDRKTARSSCLYNFYS